MFKRMIFLSLTMMIVLGSVFVPHGVSAAEKNKEIVMDLNTDVKKELSIDGGTLTVEKLLSNSPLRVNDAVYKMSWHSCFGKFNVGFTGVIANNQFIDVYDEWYRVHGMAVKSENLSIQNSKRAVYSLRVKQGWCTHNKKMISSIDLFGKLHVKLTN